MSALFTVGFDIAKNVFQAHVVDSEGKVVVRKKIRRDEVIPFFADLPPCLIGIEACSTAHHWARQLEELGHEVKLMPPVYVKPYLKRGKNDALDAEAICEAVTRPTMRFVPVKTVEQQEALMLHKSRMMLVKHRTMIVNALRAHMAELGIIVPKGIKRLPELIERVHGSRSAETIPAYARAVVAVHVGQLEALEEQIATLDAEMLAWHRANEDSRRLATIPGIGLVTATALAATIDDAAQFDSGRAMAAWLGLTPRQNSSGNKERLGRITKAGNKYLRTLLVVGSTAIIRSARINSPGRLLDWVRGLLEKKPARLVTVALANKLARIAWAVLMRKRAFSNTIVPPAPAAI